MLAGARPGRRHGYTHRVAGGGQELAFSPLVAENLNPESRNSEGLHAKRCPVPFLVGERAET